MPSSLASFTCVSIGTYVVLSVRMFTAVCVQYSLLYNELPLYLHEHVDSHCSHKLFVKTIYSYVVLSTFREVTTAFLFCARAFISGASQTLYVYTAEVYPTEVRNLGLGIAFAVGCAGSAITPYIAQVRE